MPSANDNDYNKAGGVFQIDIVVDLFATQMTGERDSFGDNYDADAQLPISPSPLVAISLLHL
ncbi:MAG: hypothetical protein GX303_02395 [Clostridiales bacterium]|nr:hypothetical protein [Clostridiales bacterium]